MSATGDDDDDGGAYCDPLAECCLGSASWDLWAALTVVLTWLLAASVVSMALALLAVALTPPYRGGRRRPPSGDYAGRLARATQRLAIDVGPAVGRVVSRESGTRIEFGRPKVCDDCCDDCCCNNCFDCCDACCDSRWAFHVRVWTSVSGVRMVAAGDNVLGPAGFYALPRMPWLTWAPQHKIRDYLLPTTAPPRAAVTTQPSSRATVVPTAVFGGGGDEEEDVPEAIAVFDEDEDDIPMAVAAPPPARARVVAPVAAAPEEELCERDYRRLAQWVARLAAMLGLLAAWTLCLLWATTTLQLWDEGGEEAPGDAGLIIALPLVLVALTLNLRDTAPDSARSESSRSRNAHLSRLLLLATALWVACSAGFESKQLATVELPPHSDCAVGACGSSSINCECVIFQAHAGLCEGVDLASNCYAAEVEDCGLLKTTIRDLLWRQSTLQMCQLALFFALFDFVLLPAHFSDKQVFDCCHSYCLSTVCWAVLAVSLQHMNRVFPALLWGASHRRWTLGRPGRLLVSVVGPVFNVRYSDLPEIEAREH